MTAVTEKSRQVISEQRLNNAWLACIAEVIRTTSVARLPNSGGEWGSKEVELSPQYVAYLEHADGDTVPPCPPMMTLEKAQAELARLVMGWSR